MFLGLLLRALKVERSMATTTKNGSKMKHLWMVEDVPAKDGGEARSFWTKVGVAFENRDGSFSLHLAAIPVNGKLQMRDPADPTRDMRSGAAE